MQQPQGSIIRAAWMEVFEESSSSRAARYFVADNTSLYWYENPSVSFVILIDRSNGVVEVS